MPKMSMPFRGRTITTSVSGGGPPWGPILLLGGLAVVAASIARAANEVGADGLTAWQRANAFVDTVFTTTLTVVAVVGGLAVAGWLAYAVLPDLTWPWQRREADALRAQWARLDEAHEQRRAEQEAERLHVEAERLDAVATAEEALAATEGLDGKRDGTLIDAADRFRSLGTFLPDQSTTVDQGPTTVDHDRPRVDREA